MSKLDGKTGIVTGSGRGIGRGIAIAMAKEGAAIVLVDKNETNVAAVARELTDLGHKALGLACDVGNRAGVNETVAAAIQTFGSVDILVNNAHTIPLGIAMEDVTDEEFQASLRSGLWGMFHYMQACFPHMKTRGGKIINTLSIDGHEGHYFLAGYSPTKEAMRALTRVAAAEWGKYNITVNGFNPIGLSDAQAGFIENFPEQAQSILDQIALGRWGDPEMDVGRAVAMLASPDMDYVTGTSEFHIDGGLARSWIFK